MADTENKVVAPKVEDKAKPSYAGKKKTNVDVHSEHKTIVGAFTTKLKNAKKVKVLGNEGLIPFLGTVFTIHVNGIVVSLPLDGKYHEFPEPIAKLLERKLSKISRANLSVNKTTKIY
jgi:hypothetical protein